MKDGFYLAAYLEIDPLAHIYMLSQRHDLNMALFQKKGNNIQLIRYWELERFMGRKDYRGAFASKDDALTFIDSQLRQIGLSLDNIEKIIGTPGLDTDSSYYKQDAREDLSYHSICHMFSSIMMDSSIFNNHTIIGLALDAGPDAIVEKSTTKNYYSGCLVRNGEIITFPVSSPSMLWLIASNYFHLKEGTLMALASATTCRTLEAFSQVLPDQMDGNAARLFEYFNSLVERVYSYKETDCERLFTGYDYLFTENENKISMIMKEVQKVSQNMVANTIERIVNKYEITPSNAYLSLSGGYALNCPCNSYLMERFKFNGFLAPPCTNDSGMSLGIGLYYFWSQIPQISFSLEHAYYGPNDDRLDALLEEGTYSYYIDSVDEFNPSVFTRDITVEPVAWFNGCQEIGPRALGARSILADARSIEMRDKLNQIKQRQWWRPVAPIVLEEKVSDWFENASVSPFMLKTFPVREDKADKIAAVAHIDKSARVQTLSRSVNPLLYDAICGVEAETGVPMLCNTSLNDRGEPIISTIEEALNFVLRKNINVIYINGRRIKIKNHKDYLIKTPLERKYIYQNLSDEEKRIILERENPFGADLDVLGCYYMMPELYSQFSLTDKKLFRSMSLYIKQLRNHIIP